MIKQEDKTSNHSVTKSDRMTVEENTRALSVRRQLEDIKDRKALNKEWELF